VVEAISLQNSIWWAEIGPAVWTGTTRRHVSLRVPKVLRAGMRDCATMSTTANDIGEYAFLPTERDIVFCWAA